MADKIQSSFSAIELPNRPSPTAGGPQTNPGVCPALNTPSTEGKIHTKWYEAPAQAPNLIGKNVAEKMDSSFRGHIIADTFNPAVSASGKGDNATESSFEAVNLVNSLGGGRGQGQGPGSLLPPSTNMNDGIGAGVNTSGGGSSNPRT